MAGAGYKDITSTDRARRLPLILIDGTSVEWPADWPVKDRADWRRRRNIEKPKAARRKQ